ncbi:hypothetical protein C439_11623 [Haloferax mediterranei ATCC 33500]|uniref:Uncharacterized protein n=1 Tax=Haloferax mediterranei (strain ATCC 33500 / DSM 1411 / JCM 8866 / NBRC 14739 / NCIMB 2177 / R-4) TaxID=523841 RepID=M0IVB2_HALMT|nr:hypothetical protein BM92_10570 [Haloferax mediterranei ATCC 33500]ELZ99982.1 hypothetical protein C439_11623 [Haloferax mediterranei ATCC 33500]
MLLDKLDAAEFFKDKMAELEPLSSDSDEANEFRYYFDGYIGSIMSIKAFYQSQSVKQFDKWTDSEWKADLHNFLRTSLRNPIHHPNEWIDEPYSGISRRMVVVEGTVCFAVGDLPKSVYEHFTQEVGSFSMSFVSVVDICGVYINLIDRWVKHVEQIETGWFRVPTIGSGKHGDSFRPKYGDLPGISGHSGNRFEDCEPGFVVKFKGTPEAIEEISGKEDAEVLDDDDVVELFNQMEHVTNFNSIEEVNKSFRTASRNYF